MVTKPFAPTTQAYSVPERIWKLITHRGQIDKEATAADRRKERRVNLSFPIAISTFNRIGDLIIERTKTLDIGEYGCRFPTCLPLERGDVLAIALLRPDKINTAQEKPKRFEVKWTTEEPNVRIIGARQTEGDTLWDVSFPASKP
jgi:hypothetical protein